MDTCYHCMHICASLALVQSYYQWSNPEPYGQTRLVSNHNKTQQSANHVHTYLCMGICISSVYPSINLNTILYKRQRVWQASPVQHLTVHSRWCVHQFKTLYMCVRRNRHPVPPQVRTDAQVFLYLSLIRISMNFFPDVTVLNNMSALVLVTSEHRAGVQLLPESVVTQLTGTYLDLQALLTWRLWEKIWRNV